MDWQRRFARVRPLLIPLLLLFLLGVPVSASHDGSAPAPGFHPLSRPVGRLVSATQGTVPPPPTDAWCRIHVSSPCYGPQEMQTAYHLTPLLNQSIDGTGQTIVIVDSFGSPTIRQDLAAFDAAFHLLPPPSFQILHPLGQVPFDPTNADMVSWARETTLDVDWAHAMAPGASIVLLTSPVAETQGIAGMPQMLAVEEYALDHHLGQIISQSWGTTEETLQSPAGQHVVAQFEAFYARAARAGVTVLAAAGDTGTANVNTRGTNYPFPTVIYPASSPWVTAVGGTTLLADTSGNYQSEVVWNDNASYGQAAAGGGGVSHLFGEPTYQRSLPPTAQSQLDGSRGIPDVAYNADFYTPVLMYLSYDQIDTGWWLFGGTSEGSPQWAGLIADGNQLAGHPLGFLNPSVYALSETSKYPTSFHDITIGDNANAGVRGFTAGTGWDLASGWGSPNATNLLHALAEK